MEQKVQSAGQTRFVGKSGASLGPWVKDVKRKFLTLVRTSDYYPLLIFEVGSEDGAKNSKENQGRPQGPGMDV